VRGSPSCGRTPDDSLLLLASAVGLDTKGTSVVPLLEIATVAVCYAVGPIMLIRWLSDLPSLGVIAVSLTICAIGYAPVAAFRLPSSVPSGGVLLSVAGLAVICTAVGFVLVLAGSVLATRRDAPPDRHALLATER
jgi:hypothetical protein